MRLVREENCASKHTAQTVMNEKYQVTAHVCKVSKICVKSLSEKLISIVQEEKSKPCGEGTISRLISKE